MFKPVACLLSLLIAFAIPAAAQERTTIGIGRLFNNDALGDQDDRWRTGSYALSWVRGPVWTGQMPVKPGALLEFRAFSEVVAPSNLASPGLPDRRYAGVLSFGVHTHFRLGSADARVGGTLVLVGPQTGLAGFQEAVHRAFGLPLPNTANQFGNAAYPMLSAESGRDLALGSNVTFRPFIEAQLGFETLARVGADVTFGHYGRGALLLRDIVTGQRYMGVRPPGGGESGVSFTIGGDFARVGKSELLPAGGTAVLANSRSRLRAGLDWHGGSTEVFYGVTWLSKEFEAQGSGQLVGSLHARIRF